MAIICRSQTERSAFGALLLRVLRPVMNHQIANVWNPSEGVGKDEHRVPLIKSRVGQQQHGAGDAQPPKRARHHHLPALLRGIPLHEEPRKKDAVAQPADHLPPMPLDTEKLVAVCENIQVRFHKCQRPRLTGRG